MNRDGCRSGGVIHSYYTENLVFLPDTYQCKDSNTSIGAAAQRGPIARAFRAEGSSSAASTTTIKITPEGVRRLDEAPRFRSTERAVGLTRLPTRWQRKLREEAERRGVSGDRLIFAPLLPSADHLAGFVADLFLDTLPAAALGESDALWSGLPSITCLGTRSRDGSVLSLHAIGLPDLVTHSLFEYEAPSARNWRTIGIVLAEIKVSGSRASATRIRCSTPCGTPASSKPLMSVMVV
jgi:predicted O-linked N-acetylglucosamine transferase (SPINDLY family)